MTLSRKATVILSECFRAVSQGPTEFNAASAAISGLRSRSRGGSGPMTAAGGVPAFDVFALPAEYQELRASVRAMADARIAPRAAHTDEAAEFPWDVHAALVQSGFNAPHIPEKYGGAGADALATAIVIEEVARACASSALIPAVNKLGTLPLLTVGSEQLRERYLPPVARGEAMFSYAL